MYLPPNSGERIAEAVAAAEDQTSAELVIVGVPFSGTYRDVEYLVGVLAGLVFLAWALFSDHHVPVAGVIPSVLMVGLVAGVGARFSPRLRRWLTTHPRRIRQAETAAEVAFLQNGVDTTRARTGVLIHVSVLEQHVTLVADRGIQSEFDANELEAERTLLDAALRQPDPVTGLCEALNHLGATLGSRLPRDDDDEDELSNMPLLGVQA